MKNQIIKYLDTDMKEYYIVPADIVKRAVCFAMEVTIRNQETDSEINMADIMRFAEILRGGE